MAVNKVTYGGSTLIDLTSDSVTTATLSKGVTAHDKSGAKITGTRPTDGEILGDNKFLCLSVVDVTIGANTVSDGKAAFEYFVGLVGKVIVAIALLNNPTTANQLVMAPGCRRKDSGSFKDYIMACRYDSSGSINATTSLYQDYNMKLVQGTKYRVWVASLFNTTTPKPY